MSDELTTGVFNLIRAPWLPVRRRSGVVESIPPWRITEQIREDPFVAFAWPRPDFNGAAHEFLIGLLSTTAALPNDDEWAGWWLSPPAPDILKERFATVIHAFDLDGPGPRFLQDLDPLGDAKESDAAALLIDAPGAQTLRNNADLFVKRGGAPVLCRAAAAMALFTLSTYAPSGGAGHRTSLRGGGPMTTLIVANHRVFGDTLWSRLWPNVETDEQIGARATDAELRDGFSLIFPWLIPTRTSDPKSGGRQTSPTDVHPLQVYWGMPRRIRLLFEDASGRHCGLTGEKDSAIVRSYRVKNYGTDYSEGFEHPLTPYYRKKESAAKLPVHPNPGGVNYRLWPGIVAQSGDGLHDPAQVVRQWPERAHNACGTRFTVFGYDMKNMKARTWIESEMPLWFLDDAITRDWLIQFIEYATAGAEMVARLLIRSVKSALHDQPAEASGDYGFIAERFYRETEVEFYVSLGEAARSIESISGADDPTTRSRENWAPAMKRAALRLFDEHAPSEGLEDRNMHRHVKARGFLSLALGGRGRDGRLLFERYLGIVANESVQAQERKDKDA